MLHQLPGGAFPHSIIAGFVNRGARSGFCAADHTDISEMVNDAEDKLVIR